MTCLSFLKSEDLPDHTFAEKAPCRTNGEQCQGMFYPDAFVVGPILTKRCISIHRRILRHTKYELWTRQIKIIGERKPEKKYPIKVIQSATRKWLRDSLSESAHVPIHRYCTLFPLITLLAALLSVFVGTFFPQSWRARALCHWPPV